MKFRKALDTHAEMIASEIEVNSLEELKAYLENEFADHAKGIAELKFDYSFFDINDDRIGYNTYNVMVRLKDRQMFWLAGISDGNFED